MDRLVAETTYFDLDEYELGWKVEIASSTFCKELVVI
jgi:hypothetical protein